MKRIRKTFLIPETLLEQLIEYQKKNFLSSMTEAAIQLIRIGLGTEKEKAE